MSGHTGSSLCKSSIYVLRDYGFILRQLSRRVGKGPDTDHVNVNDVHPHLDRFHPVGIPMSITC